MTAFPRRRIPPSARPSVLLRLSPLIAFFALIVLGGLVAAVLQSLGPPGHRFYPYDKLFMDDAFLGTLGHTVYVALVSTVVSLAIGTVGAYLLWRVPASYQRSLQVYRLPIVLPHLVIAFVVMVFFSRSGIVSSVLYRLGIIDEMISFPRILFAPNGAGMILAYVIKEAPFVMLLAFGVLARVPRRLHTTAKLLGAGESRIFFTIMVPHMAPIINQAAIILFLYTFGAFEIPYLLGASKPQMLPVYVFSRYFHGSWEDRTTAMAALVVLGLVALILVVVYTRTVVRRSASERIL